jgi:hemoglobin
MTDINNRNDIVTLVNLFYEKVKQDEKLTPFFAHVNWPAHLPTMYDFWASMLLGERTYTGAPFQKHISLGIQSEHFDRWLLLFHQTVNENFTGDKAEEVKQRAASIAGVWHYKLTQLKSE